MKRTIMLLASIAAAMITGVSIGQEHKDTEPQVTNREKAPQSPVPMILQEDDGDQLVHRSGPLGGVPFTIKVDGQFGKSEDFFVFAETLAPNQTIPFHKHHNAEQRTSAAEGRIDVGALTARVEEVGENSNSEPRPRLRYR